VVCKPNEIVVISDSTPAQSNQASSLAAPKRSYTLTYTLTLALTSPCTKIVA
jgi:hypothetical protein